MGGKTQRARGRLKLLILFVFCGFNAKAQEIFDLSALSLFWKTVDILQTDRLPDEQEWETLFSHPLYLQIEKSAQRKKPLKTVLPLVFMPSRKASLDSLLAGQKKLPRPVYLSMAKHLLEVKENRPAIENFSRAFNPEQWTKRFMQKVQTYLPRHTTREIIAPKIYIGLFEQNGFGGQSIALDAWRLMGNAEAENIAFVSHEAHHYYLGKIETVNSPQATKDEERDSIYLFYAFSSLREEGIANILDKTLYLDPAYRQQPGHTAQKRAQMEEFATFYHNSNQIIQRVDSLLQEIATGKLPIGTGGEAIKAALPWGGHPTGMYMANLIEKTLGKKTLMVTNYNYFDFILRYQQAAQKTRNRSFSPVSINLIQYCKQHYSGKP